MRKLRLPFYLLPILLQAYFLSWQDPLQAQTHAWANSIGNHSTIDNAHSLALGTNGKVFASGQLPATTDLDPGTGVSNLPPGGYVQCLHDNGTFAWAFSLPGKPLLALDTAGNLLVFSSGTDTFDMDPGPGIALLAFGAAYLAAYDSAGNYLWAKAFGGNGMGTMVSRDIVTDDFGNIFLAGDFYGAIDADPGTGTAYLFPPWGWGPDCFLIQLNGQGNFRWAQWLGTADTESISNIAVDAAGSTYVMGGCFGGLGGQYGGLVDVFLWKYTPTGQVRWMRQWGGPGQDMPEDLKISDAQVIVTGYFNGTSDMDPSQTAAQLLTSYGGSDVFVSSLDTVGSLLWSKHFGGTSYDYGQTLAIHPTGDIFVSGTFLGTADFDPGPGSVNLASGPVPKFFLLRLNTIGDYMDAGMFGGSIWEHCTDMHSRRDGSIFLTGEHRDTTDFDPGPAVALLPGDTLQTDIFLQKFLACVPVVPPVNATPTGNLAICAGQSTLLSLSGAVQPTWYAVPSGGTPIAAGASYSTPPLFVSTTYYAQDSGCNRSSRTPITVAVIQPTSSTLTASACNAYTSPSGKVWTLPGTYQDTIPNQAGCDSIVTIQLTITTSSSFTLTAAACTAYTSPSGQLWTASGTYLDTIPNYAGCDSIITIILTVSQPAITSISPTSCGPYTSPSGPLWTTSGNYADTLATVAGCDSIILVQLTIVTLDLGTTSTPPTISSSANGLAYQWIHCDSNAIPGATAQSYTATQTGSYAVIVTDGPCSDTSACTTITVLGQDSPSSLHLQAWPNPSHGHFYLQWGQQLDSVEVQVTDALGRQVATHHLHQAQGTQLHLPRRGVYLATLKDHNGLRTSILLVVE